MPAPRTSIVGQRFGRLTVLSRSAKHIRRWVCRCECGTVKEFWRSGLRSGQSSSCGCYQREVNGAAQTTHGQSKGVEYRTWLSAKTRCYNAKAPQYPNYGGRGIRMCDEWLHDFERFLTDMGPRPSSRHSIDRIDNNGPYSPDNCRWVRMTTQNNNQGRNRRLTFQGETHTLSEWAARLGIGKTTLDERLRHGWTVDRALTTPVR